MQILIQTNALRAVATCAAKKDTRYYLNGVNVEASATETIVTATDGYTVATYRHKAENTLTKPVSFIIPGDVVDQVKGGAKSDTFLTLEQDGDKWLLYGHVKGGMALQFRPIDGHCPDWRRVIPKGPASREPAVFNPEFLMRFAKAAKEFKKVFPKVEVAHNGAGAAGVSIDVDGFFGVIMPIRADGVAPWSGADPAVYAPVAGSQPDTTAA
jgi:DNA polymerase-3 subunit beta